MTMITEIEQVRADLEAARPEIMKEDAVFVCPGCGDEIIYPMIVFIDWGAPNLHECGWRGEQLPLSRKIRNNV